MLSPIAFVLSIMVPPPEYNVALERLRDGSKQANRSDSAETIAELAEALEALEVFPAELALEGAGRAQHLLALLNLARIYQNTGEDAKAAVSMDEAIFWAGDTPVPAERFGPRVAELFEERLAKLDAAGKGLVTVECGVSCSVFIDGNAVSGTTVETYVGPHQIHVRSDKEASLTTVVSVSSMGATVEYAMAPAPAAVIDRGELEAIDDEGHEPGTLVWKPARPPATWKIVGVGVSGGLFVASVGLMAASLHQISANGPLREDIIEAAENSLLDDKPSNDVDPATNGDLCALAEAAPSPDNPSQITNASVAEVCISSRTWGSIATGSIIATAVTGASTLVFGVLLGVHRAPSPAAAFMREHQLGFAVAPRPEGGLTLAGGLRF